MAALEILRRRDRFGSWLQQASPEFTWSWNHLVFLRRYLARIEDGSLKRLMVFMPPRHGKSEMVTVRFPAYIFRTYPTRRVIIGSYNQTLADKFSRKTRRLARDQQIPMSIERYAVNDWETTSGGGLRAVGVGGGITGHGGDIIIIDDPVKSREEAASKTYRDKVYDWYTDDLYTRLEPGGAMILIMTRWHEDDLAGRILNSEDGPNWTVVSLPALAEEDDLLGRKVGEALCPERYPLSVLEQIHMVLGKAFYGLYQQRPQEQEGDMFKRSWFEEVNAAPRVAKRVRYWDFAATDDAGAYTSGALLAVSERVVYVEDVVRGQWSTGKRNEIMRDTAKEDKRKYGNIETVFEEEGGSSGKDAALYIVQMMAGYTCRANRVTGDKAVRAEPFAAQCEARNVKVVKGPWNEDWYDEITAFPNGKYKDQVDSTSGAYTRLAGLVSFGDVSDLGNVSEYNNRWK